MGRRDMTRMDATSPRAASGKAVSRENVLLPDGKPFAFWEDNTKYTHTYHVAGGSPDASDDNDGSAKKPFRTIQQAANLLQPGERVIIHQGHYREHVRPQRGGTSSKKMICYQAAPGESVILSGSEVYAGAFHRTTRWESPRKIEAPVWHAQLPSRWFIGQLPFAAINMPQRALDEGPKNGIYTFPPEHLKPLLLRRGLVFQDGRRLRQVASFADLSASDGVYWCERDGLSIHLRPFGDVHPAHCLWEFTTREQVFASDVYGHNYIRVDGLTIQHAADGFPWPQRAALSAMHGTHWIIENCTIQQVNAAGIDLGRQDPCMTDLTEHGFHILRKNHIRECGITGICGTARPMTGLLIEDNRIENIGWHDVERLFETAAIKVHWSKDCLLRRNRIHDTIAAPGIWLDYGITNCRITQNTFLNVNTTFGAVFLEVARIGEILVDNNIIYGSRGARCTWAGAAPEARDGGDGIYSHDCDRHVIAHNLIAGCEGAAIRLKLGETDRMFDGRGSTCRNHRILNNILLDCGTMIELGRPDNLADGNIYHQPRKSGAWRIEDPREWLNFTSWQEFHGHDSSGSDSLPLTLSFDSAALTLTVDCKSPLPQTNRLPFNSCDFLGNPRTGNQTFPGPLPLEQLRLVALNAPTR